uniref:Uncharacterized protein n=1 Tax=Pseudo-nitzschia australis TaxID=44445 RepID=A0A7S4AXQ4_9STRA|eukprot:CAMPEP_0168182670 /NCGR_PEP_ID=MMETSP0139_2-20121125/12017_1 /TAXON_ID=44445 /ORGANISM="Pseudo-nitzschia australis, Strain 10249 10 AB" /LENGTH=270 /DNA_ID=CAMNT_0008103615 /DNA_START=50 /DNA_END=862 /DNA_ORIENTATION=+
MKFIVTHPFHFLSILLAGSSIPKCSRAWSSADGIPTSASRNSKRRRISSSSSHFSSPHHNTRGAATFPSAVTNDGDVSLSSKRSNRNHDSSRREVLRQSFITVTLATIGAISVPKAALADVTNKIASSTALRSLKRAQDQLPTKLLPEAQRNNFVGVKARLREAPFDEFRKNALILVRGGEDGPKASDLLLAYKELIAAVEAMDATASLGMKGRSVDSFRLGTQYEDVAKALDSFLKVGSEAASIPLQESPSMQDNLRYGSIDSKVLKSE